MEAGYLEDIESLFTVYDAEASNALGNLGSMKIERSDFDSAVTARTASNEVHTGVLENSVALSDSRYLKTGGLEFDIYGQLSSLAFIMEETIRSFVTLAEVSPPTASEQPESEDEGSLPESERSEDFDRVMRFTSTESIMDDSGAKGDGILNYRFDPGAQTDDQRESFGNKCGGELFTCHWPVPKQPSGQEILAARIELDWPTDEHTELFKALLKLAGLEKNPWEIFKMENRTMASIEKYIKTLRYDKHSGIDKPLFSHLPDKVQTQRLIGHFLQGMCEHIFRVHKAKGCRYLPRLEPGKGIAPEHAFQEKYMRQLYDAIERIAENGWKGERPKVLKKVDKVLKRTGKDKDTVPPTSTESS